MSSRKFINSGDYRLVLQNGRLVVQRPDADQGTAAIEIGYDGAAPSGYIGVTNGAFKYGFDASVPFDVYHEGRPPDVTEIDLLGQDFPSARVPNVLYVAENGVDSNTGERLSEPKRTIKAAMATADLIQARGMGLKIRSGQTHNDYNGQGSNGRFVGGTGYNATDLIALADETEITVTSVSGGAVTGFEVTVGGQQEVLPRQCAADRGHRIGIPPAARGCQHRAHESSPTGLHFPQGGSLSREQPCAGESQGGGMGR